MPTPLAHRVARKFRAATLDLKTLQITSENLEDILNDLIAGVEDIEKVEQELGLDLRNMTKIMQASPHNDDLHHNGEDVLTHIGWVLDDVAKLTANMSAEKQLLLKLTALCHDLGKPYTYKFNEEKQRHTFYDHATKSVQVAEALLARHKDALGELYQDVLDFTRLHDVFFALVHDRSKQPAGSTRYVKNLLQESVYRKGLLNDLLTFAKADSARARSHAESIKDFEGVVSDTARAEQEAAAEAERAEAARVRLLAVTEQRMPEIRALLEIEAPEAAALLPDLSAVRRVLGQAKRYDIIKGIEGILRRP